MVLPGLFGSVKPVLPARLGETSRHGTFIPSTSRCQGAVTPAGYGLLMARRHERNAVLSLGRRLRSELARGLPAAWDLGQPSAPRLGAPFAIAWVLEALDPPRTRLEVRLGKRARQVWMAWGRAAGWTYDPLDSDLGEDADDLAMVLRLLGRRALRAIPGEEDRLRALLTLNRLEPGRYRTWLVPSREEMGATDRRRYSGDRPDHDEVVANLLEAMLCFAPVQARREVEAGAEHLITRLQDGLLASAWYPGWGYGTWRLLELTSRLARGDRVWTARHRHVALGAVRAIARLPRRGGLWLAGPAPGVLARYGEPGGWPCDRPSVHETAWVLGCLSRAPATRAVLALEAAGRRALLDSLRKGLVSEPAWVTDGPACHAALDLTRAVVRRALVPGTDEGCRIGPPSRTMGRRSRKEHV